MQADPLVKAVLERFPGAQIVGVRGGKEPPPDLSRSHRPARTCRRDEDGFGDNWIRETIDWTDTEQLERDAWSIFSA